MSSSAAGKSEDRRTRIADTALQLLAREGARGLTHRAVDGALGLPAGSTSYYHRTRAALLLAAAERMLALDLQELGQITPDASGVARLIGGWLSPHGRERSLARMELLLAAARDPELSFMVKAREQLIAHAVQALRAAEPGTSERAQRTRATALIALVDGLMLHGLVTGSLSARSVEQMIAGMAPVARAGKRPQSGS